MRIFIERALKDQTIEIHGDGTQIRAWCYVDDMIEGTLRAMTSPKAIGEIIPYWQSESSCDHLWLGEYSGPSAQLEIADSVY